MTVCTVQLKAEFKIDSCFSERSLLNDSIRLSNLNICQPLTCGQFSVYEICDFRKPGLGKKLLLFIGIMN